MPGAPCQAIWEFPTWLFQSWLFAMFTLFCALLRPFALFCELALALFCALLRTCACALLRAFTYFCERPRFNRPRLAFYTAFAQFFLILGCFQLGGGVESNLADKNFIHPDFSEVTLCQLSGPLRLRVQSRSRTRLRIAASIAFLFRACFKEVLDTIAPLSRG